MILATFIVMLATYNLSPRNDAHNYFQVPLAEAAITKFTTQHKAAIEYAKDTIKNYREDPSNNTPLTQGNITGCNSSGSGSLCDYLPIGYKFDDIKYYSTIYCLNKTIYEDVIDETTGLPKVDEETGRVVKAVKNMKGTLATGNCSDASSTAIFVISYGRVPERWKNVSTKHVLGDFYTAMRKSINAGDPCGIAVPKSSRNANANYLNSDYVIEGVVPQNSSIPAYFLNNDNTFKSKCSLDIGGPNPCLIYVSEL